MRETGITHFLKKHKNITNFKHRTKSWYGFMLRHQTKASPSTDRHLRKRNYADGIPVHNKDFQFVESQTDTKKSIGLERAKRHQPTHLLKTIVKMNWQRVKCHKVRQCKAISERIRFLVPIHLVELP